MEDCSNSVPSPSDSAKIAVNTAEPDVAKEGEENEASSKNASKSAEPQSAMYSCQRAVYLPAVLFNKCCLHQEAKSTNQRQFVLVSPVEQPFKCQFCSLCMPQLSSCLPNECKNEAVASHADKDVLPSLLVSSKQCLNETQQDKCLNASLLLDSVNGPAIPRCSVPLKLNGHLECGNNEPQLTENKGFSTVPLNLSAISVGTQTDLCIHPSKLISFSDFESNEDLPSAMCLSALKYFSDQSLNNGIDENKSYQWEGDASAIPSNVDCPLHASTSTAPHQISNLKLCGPTAKPEESETSSKPTQKNTREKSCNTYTFASEMKKEQKHSSLLQHLQCQIPQSPAVAHHVQNVSPEAEGCEQQKTSSAGNQVLASEASDTKLSGDQKFYSFPRKNNSVAVTQFNSLPHPHKNGFGDNSADQETFSPTRLDDWIHLNVGGKEFTTSRATLILEEPESMLAKMFGGQPSYLPPASQDSKGFYIIDRSPQYFSPLLNYLRTGLLVIDAGINPEGVLQEAKYFGLEGVIPKLEKMVEQQTTALSDISLTRHDVVKALLSSSPDIVLRFQAVNLRGADLSWLDLRNINFKYADLRDTNLTGANLSGCNLERAKMSGACLEQAQLLNVRLVCADLQDANLRRCNFENPSGGEPPNCEGVNLRNSNLEGSFMATVNLRVSTLKNANLSNCDLRMSVLAGADMENCDLTGSNLLNANLRGANLKNASFKLMQTPLHMSQTCDL